MNDTDQDPQPAPRADLGQGPTPAPTPTPTASSTATPTPTAAPGTNPGANPGYVPPTSSSFDMNRPTIISILYLSSMVLGVTALVGVVLAYVWKGEAHAEWETSHYQYLINTFWIGLVGTVISVFLMILLIGFLLIFAVWVLVLVRCVLSLINAQKCVPMPNPATLLA